MSRALRYTLSGVAIFISVVAVVAAGFGISAWQVHQDQLQWCATLDLLTSQPVPRPANPAANPSREQAYQLYTDFMALRGRFGC